MSSRKVKAGFFAILCIVFYALALWLIPYSQQPSSPKWLQTYYFGYIMSGIAMFVSLELYHQSRTAASCNKIVDKQSVSKSTSTVAPTNGISLTTSKATLDDNLDGEKDFNAKVIS